MARLAASAVPAGGLSPLPLPTAVAADAAGETLAAEAPQETVVPAALRSTPLSARLRASSLHAGQEAAGAQGVSHSLEGTSGLLWTRYADGETVSVPAAADDAVPRTTGTDVLAYQYSDRRFDFWDATDGSRSSLRVPDDLGYLTTYDRMVIAFRHVTLENGTVSRVMHLLTPGPDGTTDDLTVTGEPAGLRLGTAAGTDARTVHFHAYLPNGAYDWTVTVTPADGVGAPLEVTGTVQLRDGAPVRHDHTGARA